MRCLSAASLLSVWEKGQGESVTEWSLELLEATCPGESRDELARLAIGERDARLLALRESAFGCRVAGIVNCPACGEASEVELDTSELRLPRRDDREAPFSVASADGEICFRLPDSADLIALEGASDAEDGLRLLVRQCVVDARRSREEVPPDRLSQAAVAELSAAMERADPQANIELALTCSACDECWSIPFDIASFLRTETDAWAWRTLAEVHSLASTYGWDEAAILGMTARRRTAYLALIE